MIIANYMLQHTDIERVWMVVTPHNPFKNKKTLAKNYDRLHLVTLAIGDNLRLKASDIEFSLPQPSYTIDTMTYVQEKYPEHQFSLIMGGDNLATLHKWKNYEILLKHHRIFVYKRPDAVVPELAEHENIIVCEAPLLDISASYIRNEIKNNRSIQYLVPDSVYQYLNESPIYKRLLQSNEDQ